MCHRLAISRAGAFGWGCVPTEEQPNRWSVTPVTPFQADGKIAAAGPHWLLDGLGSAAGHGFLTWGAKGLAVGVGRVGLEPTTGGL